MRTLFIPINNAHSAAARPLETSKSHLNSRRVYAASITLAPRQIQTTLPRHHRYQILDNKKKKKDSTHFYNRKKIARFARTVPRRVCLQRMPRSRGGTHGYYNEFHGVARRARRGNAWAAVWACTLATDASGEPCGAVRRGVCYLSALPVDRGRRFAGATGGCWGIDVLCGEVLIS